MSTVHRATAAPRIVATTLLGGLITGLLGMASVAAGETPDAQLEIVLDSSGSMGAADPGGGTKIEAARAALNGAVDVLPDEAAVGVRVYGGRYDDEARGCTDTRLVTPLGPLDRTASKAAFAGLRPLGYTPIAFSLEQAATDFTTQGPRTIVLVSDGEETCGGNPCEVARTLAQAGVDLRVDTVGYAADPATRQQLQCIAEATGGQYSEAPDGAALAEELSRLSDRAFRAYEATGEPVSGADSPAAAPLLQPGQYLDQLGSEAIKWYAMDLTAGVTPYFAATIVPPSGQETLRDFGTVALELVTADGTTCGTKNANTAQVFGGTPTTNVARPGVVGKEWTGTFDANPEVCGAPGRYAVGVSRGVDRGTQALPIELRVLMEPAVADLADLPPAVGDELGEPAQASDVRGEVSGGTTFNTAAEVGTGTWTTDIKAGETQYFRVPVTWGQSLSWSAAMPADATPYDAGNVILPLRTQGYSPAREPIGGNDSPRSDTYLGRGSGATANEALPPVTYRNRVAENERISAVSLAGDYVIAVNVGQQSEYGGVLPLSLTVQVTGEEAGVPTYLDTGTAGDAEAAAPSGSATSGSSDHDEVNAAGDASESGSVDWQPVAYTAGGVAAVLAAASLLLIPWLRGRRR